MFRLAFILLFTIASTVCSAEIDPFRLLDRAPNKLEKSINAVTGEYYFTQDDLVIHGVEPIYLKRVYISGAPKEPNAGWAFFPHIELVIKRIPDTNIFEAVLYEPDGVKLFYRSSKVDSDQYFTFEVLPPEKTVTSLNDNHCHISANPDYQKNKLRVNFHKGLATVTMEDGNVRVYKSELQKELDEVRFNLSHIEKLNGNHHFYSYDEHKRLIKTYSTNPDTTKTYAWAKFHYLGEPGKVQDFDVTTSTGHKASYRFWRKRRRKDNDSFHLSWADSSQQPTEQVDYQALHRIKNPQVAQRILPNGMVVELDYYHKSHNKLADGTEVYVPDENDVRYERIKNVSFPYGKNGMMRSYYVVKYTGSSDSENMAMLTKSDRTEVTDCLGKLIVYHTSDDHTTKQIDYYDGDRRLQQKRKFFWGKGLHKGKLMCRAYADGEDKNLLAQYFSYDEKGNLINETVYGNLSGDCSSPLLLNKDGTIIDNGIESLSKQYSYTDEHQLLQSEKFDTGLVRYYFYSPGTDRLISRIICENDTPMIRYFYDYDKDGVLIYESVDDGNSFQRDDDSGVTERQIFRYKPKQESPAIGLTEEVVHSYFDFTVGLEKLLSKKVFSYGDNARVIREDVYDANEKWCYAIETEYDSRDLVVFQTTPLGYSNRFTYDAQHNPKYFEKANENPTYYEYDPMNRVVGIKQIDAKGNAYQTKYEYNFVGQRTAEITPQQNTINYTYDTRGYCVEIMYPPMQDQDLLVKRPSHRFSRDNWGNPIEEIDLNGQSSFYAYNAYHLPVQIIQADNTVLKRKYDTSGQLIEAVNEKGGIVRYQYDFLGRIIRKAQYSPSDEFLSEERWIYGSLHLLTYIDAAGVRTTYTYDGAGRKIREERSVGQQVKTLEYEYDSLGNCSSTLHYSDQLNDKYLKECRIFDVEKNIIEKWKEDQDGNKADHFSYIYDRRKNRTQVVRHTQQGDITSQYKYDYLNRLIEYKSPSEHVTCFIYDDAFINELQQKVSRRETVFPDQNKQIEEYDTFGRVVSFELLNINSTVLKKEKYFYDAVGNKTKQVAYVHRDGEFVGTQETRWEYNPLGKLVRLIEMNNADSSKVTQYNYDTYGNLIEVIKPDAVQLHLTYNDFNRIDEVTSSDHSIHYKYSYNNAGLLIELKNMISGKSTCREYDGFGNEIREVLETGIEVSKTYDNLNRLTSVHFHDHGSIEYDYNGFSLIAIRRKNENGEELYFHQYTKFDDFQNPLEQQLAQNLGCVRIRTDKFGRCLSITSPYSHHEISEIDSYGYITQMRSTVNDSLYIYDELHQLTAEKGLISHEYGYDSQYNRTSKDFSDYKIDQNNQLLAGENLKFSYDKNGNILSQINMPFYYEYKYDAFDRLIYARFKDVGEFFFHYDAYNRRVGAKFVSHDASYDKNYTKEYLYFGDIEVGEKMNSALKSFKVLSTQDHKTPSIPVALEINKSLYIPLFDLQGNISHMVDPKKDEVIETYHYTAFGEMMILDSNQKRISKSLIGNPWLYQGKRYEFDLGLIDFGKRFYSSELGRWFSPMPAGFLEPTNPYQYVYNDPLSFLDQDIQSSLSPLPTNLFEDPMNSRAIDDTTIGKVVSEDAVQNLVAPITNIMKIAPTSFINIVEKQVREMASNSPKGRYPEVPTFPDPRASEVFVREELVSPLSYTSNEYRSLLSGASE